MEAYLGIDVGSVTTKLAALDEKDPMFVLIARTWPEYQRLRADPRFQKIVGELHFPT